MPEGLGKASLERLYRKYNRREFVHPDPLEFLYSYRRKADREIAGMVASSLAYGRVKQILRSVEIVLGRLGPRPHDFLAHASSRQITGLFADFKHRVTAGDQMSAMLIGIKRAIDRYGTLNECFLDGYSARDETVLPALGSFAEQLGCPAGHLVPVVAKGSACKRLNLYLRWMLRNDEVDPGGWKGIPPSKLIIPLDTHMASIGTALGMTSRKSPDMKMALQITDAFRQIAPDDPVRYDFCLTRFGIRSDMTMADLLDGN